MAHVDEWVINGHKWMVSRHPAHRVRLDLELDEIISVDYERCIHRVVTAIESARSLARQPE